MKYKVALATMLLAHSEIVSYILLTIVVAMFLYDICKEREVNGH